MRRGMRRKRRILIRTMHSNVDYNDDDNGDD